VSVRVQGLGAAADCTTRARPQHARWGQHAVSRRRPSRRRQRPLLALARSCTWATEMHADTPPLASSACHRVHGHQVHDIEWAWRRVCLDIRAGSLRRANLACAHQEPLPGRRARRRAPSSCHELLRHARLSSQCDAMYNPTAPRPRASNALRLARRSTPCTSAAASNKPITLRLRGRWQPGWQPPNDPSLVVPLSRRRRAQQRRHPRQQRRHPRQQRRHPRRSTSR